MLSLSRKYRVTHFPTIFLPEVQYPAHVSASTKSPNCGEPYSSWTHAGLYSVTSTEEFKFWINPNPSTKNRPIKEDDNPKTGWQYLQQT